MSVRVDMGRQGLGGVRAWQSLLNMLENLLKIGECVLWGCTAPSLCGQRDPLGSSGDLGGFSLLGNLHHSKCTFFFPTQG